jgi:NHL repeat
VTTIAGNSRTPGSADGTGILALFFDPQGIAIDAMGNLYTTDTHIVYGFSTAIVGASIRKITPSAVVSTVAGTANTQGSADGIGAAALFNDPVGIAMDPQGSAYVADEKNCAIRIVTQAGAVTTFAGVAGQCAAADGVAAIARFKAPIGIARDSAGNFYVVDGGSAIRKIAPDGTTTTVWGDSTKAGLELSSQPGTFFSAYGLVVVDDHTLAITTGTNVLKLTVP